MAILLEARSANGAVTRTPLEPGRNTFRAQPNTRYRIVDDTGAKIDDGVSIKRVGNDLLVTGLPEERLVEFDGFFLRCTPKNPCELMLENLGGTTPGASITPVSEPVAALRDGSFLMYETKAVAGTVPVAPEAEAPQSLKTVGLVVAGLAVLGAGGGGGGGGGGGSAPDSSAPTAPVLTSGTSSKSARPVFTGTAEPGSQVSVFVDVDHNGSFSARYTVQAAADGSWRVDTATAAPTSGVMRDLPTNSSTAVRILSADASNNVSPPLSFELAVDTVAPAAPTIAAVTDDDIVNGAERATGVRLHGTAEAGSTVVITWGTLSRTVTADASGAWSYQVAPAEMPPDDPNSVVTAMARDAAGNESVGTNRQVALDSTSQLVIGPIASDGTVNAAERAAGVTVSGTARPGTSITLTWGASTQGPVFADANGHWSTTFGPGQVPPDGPATTLTARAQDPLGNVETRTRDVPIDSVAPASPVITDGTAAAVTNQPVTFSFAFAEPPGAFSASSIDVTGGTAGTFTTIDATHYTLVVNPTPGVQNGTIQVSVPAGRITDAAGNPNATGAAASQSYDTQPPAAPTITDNAPLSHAPGPVTFTFTFGEPPAAGTFTIDDVAVSGGTKGAFSQLDATHYSLVVNPAGVTGTIEVAVSGSSFTDVVGHPGTGSSNASQPFNTQIPSIVGIVDDRPAPLTNLPTTFTFTLSEAPGANPFTASDILVTGGTAQAFTAIDATHYSLVVAPTPGINAGQMQVSVAAGAFSNNAGTTNTAGASASQAYDTAPPSQTLTLFALIDDVFGPVPSGGITADASPTLLLSLNGPLQTGDTLHVMRDGVDVFTSTSGLVTTFSFQDSPPPRPLDDYVYTARVTDTLGNINDLVLNYTVTVFP